MTSKDNVEKQIDLLIADMFLEYKLLEVQLNYLLREKEKITDDIFKRYTQK